MHGHLFSSNEQKSTVFVVSKIGILRGGDFVDFVNYTVSMPLKFVYPGLEQFLHFYNIYFAVFNA